MVRAGKSLKLLREPQILFPLMSLRIYKSIFDEIEITLEFYIIWKNSIDRGLIGRRIVKRRQSIQRCQ